MGFIEPTKFEWRTRPDGTRYRHAVRGSRFKARYRDLDGRPRSQTFGRKIDAERFLERAGADMQRGDWIDPSMRRTTFADWASEWWATTLKLRPNTRRGYWLLLTNHALPYFGHRSITTIDYMDVERFISEKLGAGHGPKHVREMVSVVSLIMKCALKANARRDNPAADHELRVPRRRPTRSDMLTMEQAILVIENVPDRYKAGVWLLLYTGMRPAELCGLKISDIDFIRGTVHVLHSRSPVPGFDGGTRDHVEGPAKTDSVDRLIPLPEWLCRDLAALLAARAESRGSPLGGHEHTFLNAHGHPVNRDTFRAKIIRPALRAAGLDEQFRTYDFRHLHASMLIDDGANPLAVAERMGHADASVTLRVYGHLFKGVQEQLTTSIDTRRQAAAEATKASPVVNLKTRRRRV